MGTNIKMYLEKRVGEGEEKAWVSLDKWTFNPDYALRKSPTKFYVADEDMLYSDRDYSLFGILAGIKNPKYEMISPLKDLPTDLSDEVFDMYSFDSNPVHSVSWLTLREIQNYNWDKEGVHEEAFITKERAEKELGQDKILFVEQEDAFCWVTYKMTLREEFSRFLEAVRQMERHVYENERFPNWSVSPNDVRIVFWFVD